MSGKGKGRTQWTTFWVVYVQTPAYYQQCMCIEEMLFCKKKIYYYDWWLKCIFLKTFSYWALPQLGVPAGSPSRCGDNAVCVPDINQPSLPTPFYSVLVSVSVFMTFLLYFIPWILPTTLHFLTLFFWSRSALLVLWTIYLFMKVSLNPVIIFCGGLGLKHQLTN